MDTRGQVMRKLKFKFSQLFVVAGTILVSLLISLLCVGLTVRYEVDTGMADVQQIEYWKLNLPREQDVWFEKGIEELRDIVIEREQFAEVENVVIFIADGVNNEMLSKARFRQNDNIDKVSAFIWDTFPYLGLLKSSCIYEEHCDAFTLGTALFGGVKTSKRLGGLDRRVSPGSCHQDLNESYHIRSIFREAKTVNMRTGLVTTRRVSGPLLAALYAHSSNTEWECDHYLPESLKTECFDVASQLIKSKEGRNINVIMGGGRQTLVSLDGNSERSTFDESACISLDKRNLLRDWQTFKLRENVTFQAIQSLEALELLEGSTNDYVLGIFANGDLSETDPNLKNMVKKSLDVLKRNNSGYILVAETTAKTYKAEMFHRKLWDLDETIQETLKHPSFTPENTVLMAIFLDLNRTTNAANDILLYATGPKSDLFNGVHDETYLAHVIMYYLRMGPFRPRENLKRK